MFHQFKSKAQNKKLLMQDLCGDHVNFDDMPSNSWFSRGKSWLNMCN